MEQAGRRTGLDLIFGCMRAANGLGKNSDEGKESGPRRYRPLETKITLERFLGTVGEKARPYKNQIERPTLCDPHVNAILGNARRGRSTAEKFGTKDGTEQHAAKHVSNASWVWCSPTLETWADLARLMAECEVRQLQEWHRGAKESPAAGRKGLAELV